MVLATPLPTSPRPSRAPWPAENRLQAALPAIDAARTGPQHRPRETHAHFFQGVLRQYKYDSVYRLTSTDAGAQGVDARGFERGTFTNANRTSMAGGVAFSQDYDLDGVGNWPRYDNNGTVDTRTHSDFNEIVTTNGNTLTHDKNGNTTDDSINTYEFDALNRIKKATNKGTTLLVGTYTYDCHNRRMRKVVTNSGGLNGTTDFYYEGWRVTEEHDVNDAITQQYTYGNYLDEVWTLDNRVGNNVASLNDVTGAQRHFYHQNTLYHVYGITDETGALVEAYQYDAYGKQTVITDGNDGDTIVNFNGNDVRTVGGNSAVGNTRGYTGQTDDRETGLVYMKNRYMSTDLGRFVSRDPKEDVDSENLYQYVSSQPTIFIDPDGLEEEQGTMDYRPPRPPKPPKPKPVRRPSISAPETDYLKSHCFWACLGIGPSRIKRSANEARWKGESLADEVFGRGSDTPGHQALRHCVTLAELAKDLGCECAKCLGDAREDYQDSQGQDPRNTQRAKFNNAQGIECVCEETVMDCGATFPTRKIPKPSTKDIQNCCLNKLARGDLDSAP